MDEYDKALAEPAHALFRVIDADNDNQFSLAELQQAEQILADQIFASSRARATELASSRVRPGSTSRSHNDSAVSTTGVQTPIPASAPR